MSDSAPIDELTLPNGILVEGIVTTANGDGSTNISPMGPIVNAPLSWLRLRPYQTSTTYKNLKRDGEGIFHITDNVLLLARAAVSEATPKPALIPASEVRGQILEDCCRWFAFRVESLNDSAQRTEILARVVETGHVRDFLGFNRAKHAVLEAAILATRIEFLPAEHIHGEFGRLAALVDKTGGKQEHEAFGFLKEHVRAGLQELADGREQAVP